MSDNTNADLYPAPVIRAGKGPGPAMRMLILGLVLIGTAALYFLFGESLGDRFLLGLLGILAMIGVFYLFASVIGFISFGPQSEDDGLSRAFMDSLPVGTIITDAKGRIVYANRAYAEVTGVSEPGDVRTIENILSHDSEASDVIYRIANTVHDGVADQEELRLSRPLNPASGGGPVWYRVSARPFGTESRSRGPLYAWQIADISKERAEQERFFQDLQQAIDHLDKAPAGFFSSDADGRVVYINATLAEWLGVDLTTFTPGALRLGDIIAGNGMALLNSIKADPGTSRTAVIDLDLAKSSGQSLAVRFYHRVQVQRDGSQGTSRTIVLNRAEGADASAALRSAEVRFTRFFNSAPMAIAAVDVGGRVLSTNARFLDLFSTVVDRDAIDRRVRLDTVVHERDREAFGKALAAAFAGQADISPVDTVLPDDEERHVRFYVSAVSDLGGEGVDEAAIVYGRRHDRAEGARGPDRPGPEDAGGRPARRRHRARLQQRADGHHHGLRPAADQPPPVRPVLPGHHEHQAERQPCRLAGAPAARLLAPPDAAAGGARPDRRARRPAHAACPARRQRRRRSRSIMAATCGRSRPISASSSR